jgi:hypothetical protein
VGIHPPRPAAALRSPVPRRTPATNPLPGGTVGPSTTKADSGVTIDVVPDDTDWTEVAEHRADQERISMPVLEWTDRRVLRHIPHAES